MNVCFLQVISVIVMSQLISELAHHDGRGKIIALLGINIEEFDTNEDNATVMKRNDSKIIMLNNSEIENNSTITKGMAKCKFMKRFMYVTMYISQG